MPTAQSVLAAVRSVVHDARFAIRALFRQPGFTAIAVLSLALGIGLNTSLFTVIDALLFKPLPIASADTLVSVYTTGESDDQFATTSYPDFKDLAAENQVFDAIVGHGMMFTALGVQGQYRMALGEVVTGNYFSVLGVPLALGGGFDAGNDRGEGARPIAVLSDALWRGAFGGRADVLGQSITLRQRPYTITGVAPSWFHGLTPGLDAELWIPISMVGDVEPFGMNDVVPSPGDSRLTRRGTRWMFTKARVKDGITPAAAEANLAAIMARLAETYPTSNRGRRPRVVPASAVRLHPMIDDHLRPASAVLMAAVGLVLLVVCANLASLLLARGAARSREMGIRAALGAGRWRLVRQLVVESAVLSLAGGALGFILARVSTRLLLSIRSPVEIPLVLAFEVDGRVLGFAMGLSLLTALISGLLPAVRASRTDLVSFLKSDGSLASGPGRRMGLRHALVAGQVAVSFVLVVGGLLLARSVVAGRAMSPGFESRGLAVATTGLDMQGYTTARARDFFERAVERVRALPGVQNVAVSERMPLTQNIQTTAIVIDGQPERLPPTGLSVDATIVSETYFDTLGVRILDGRAFDNRDGPSATRVAVIDETLAHRLWPRERAVGQRLRLRDQTGPVVEIVGVSADYKVRTLGEAPRSLIHFARLQGGSSYGTIVARTSGDVGALVRGMERELRAIDPQLVLMEMQPFEGAILTSLLPVRVGAWLIGALAALGMVVAGLGLYGVIAFSVNRRTREIGIRMALGADRAAVVRYVAGEALAVVAVGAGIGLTLAAIASQALAGVLYGVTARDPVSYAVALVVVLVAAGAASFAPARRAATLNPITALGQG